MTAFSLNHTRRTKERIVQIIASAPQPAGYLTIIQHDAPSRRRRCACADTRTKRFARTLGVLAVAGGWLLLVAGLADFFTPDDAERVRDGFGKIALMAAFMGGIGWLSARPAMR
jgi:hypothetical protein